jgi:hypothetical protein
MAQNHPFIDGKAHRSSVGCESTRVGRLPCTLRSKDDVDCSHGVSHLRWQWADRAAQR